MTYEETIDHFGDGDLAIPANMAPGKRYIGKVTEVDTSASEVGNFKTFEKALKDGRTSIPIITVKLRAVKGVDGSDFDPDANVMQGTSMDFWIGKEDKIGRHSLANLVRKCTGIDDEALKSMRVQDAARQLIGAFVTFEVQIREWNGGEFQRAVKVKAASDEEKALAIA
jgi:hypothetical protein